MTRKQSAYHEKTKIRDLALITLLLGTGIRVSECVGLDINDVDFNNNGVLIRRKGGYEQVVYFGDEVERALRPYIEERKHIIPAMGHEQALFLSLQNRRLSVRSVEKLVKKYVEACLPEKAGIISPHNLRSSFAMSFYAASGNNIILLQKKLNHKSILTTSIYARASETEMIESRSILQGLR